MMEGSSGVDVGFKNLVRRVAHAPKSDVFKVTAKIDSVIKATKRSIKKGGKRKTQSSEEEEIDAARPIVKPRVKLTIAKGFVQNDYPIKPQTENDDCKKSEGEASRSLKVKLNWGSSTMVARLRPKQPKPESLNEDNVYLKRYRKAYLERENMEALKMSSNKGCKKKIKTENMDSDSNVDVKGGASSSKAASATATGTNCVKGYEVEGEPGYEESPEVELRDDGTAVDWDLYLEGRCENLHKLRPVTDFPLAPFRNIWDDFAKVGLAVEIRNCFVKDEEIYWIGTIERFAGYKALVLLEDFGTNPKGEKYMSWINYCTAVPKHLGWAKENGKKLAPGCVVKNLKAEELIPKIQKFLEKPTIRTDHLRFIYQQFAQLEKLMKPNWMYEAVDHTDKHSHRLIKIKSILGNRLNVLYYAKKDEEANRESWFDYRSPDIRRFMWAHSIGARLRGVNSDVRANVFDKSMFPVYPKELKIKKWMRLETVHPKSTHKLVGAVIVQVLRYGYFILRTNEKNEGKRKMRLYHVTSPFVLPVGFGESHDVQVDDSLDDSKNVRINLDLSLLPPRSNHPFKEGDKVEAVFTVDSDFVGPATIRKVAGHMLYVHFDGWSDHFSNYQWIDAHESEIYPAGYCEMLKIDWKGNVELD